MGDQNLIFLVKDIPIDVHEIAADIELEDIGGGGIAFSCLAHESLHPSDAVARAEVLTAAIAVIDEETVV